MVETDIMQYSPVAQFAIGTDHKITRWNRACELLTGRSAEEMIGTDRHWEPFYPNRRPMLADLIVEHDRLGILKLYGEKKVARSKVIPHAWESSSFFENVGGQERYLQFLAAPIFDVKGNISGALETFLDITEQKHFEQALMQSEEGYRILAENVPDGVALMQGGVYVLVNQAFALLFGYNHPEQLIGKQTNTPIAHEHKELFTKTLQAIESGEPHEKILRWRCITRDGREIWVEGHPNFVKWKNKPAVLSTVIDITETRSREAAMQEEAQRLRRENIQLKSTASDRYKFRNIVGKSQVMQDVYDLILKAASSDANVIVYGESGTGKELVARAIHDISDCRSNSFVAVNCGAIPENLLEREFFGHKKGAFTGAHKDTGGFLDQADGGTLFLDEVGELSVNLQVKLLRAIEDGEYTPVGGNKSKRSNFRIIAATLKNLVEQVRKGHMREDFFYRIHIIPIQVPPLRDRMEDIPFLVDYFLQSSDANEKLVTIPPAIMKALYNYDWPGNVRELQNALSRYLVVGRLDFIHSEDTSVDAGEDVLEEIGVANLKSAVERLERSIISDALKQTNWNRTKAASLLGIPRKTLFRKMKKIGIQ
ncbi:MAG: sigma 54-interacting transcriptional regulator [Deltaproteobacteria bacterium]|nr:sigma 54-interacting transcriptional regulator [Deltaproteobacteria bacterium]MBW2051294.1 sigma 54-interacting transcriptional regulator [Deltaproteobacteria bacterium]MBW2141339.1 sigma 54-interacting transcriptional regulator [Deltaproteobacteria bacterium]MBW2323785.1 sigma 54-interacting transcriptional regulator [Deltaproteobacteria bacterium]